MSKNFSLIAPLALKKHHKIKSNGGRLFLPLKQGKEKTRYYLVDSVKFRPEDFGVRWEAQKAVDGEWVTIREIDRLFVRRVDATINDEKYMVQTTEEWLNEDLTFSADPQWLYEVGLSGKPEPEYYEEIPEEVGEEALQWYDIAEEVSHNSRGLEIEEGHQLEWWEEIEEDDNK